MRKNLKYYLISLMLVSMVIFTGCRPRPVKVEVPDLIGMEMENAIETVELVSLNPDALVGEVAPEEELENMVYFQAPDAGERVRKGSIVTFTSYDEYVSVRPQRPISFLWMGDERWEEELGGTHVVSFHEPCTPDWYEASDLKLIMYFKTDNLDVIAARVNEWKDHKNLGGYWLISGHEPDITGGDADYPEGIVENNRKRVEQYDLIRSLDPDKWNHPVFIFYDMTSSNLPGYPGWEMTFQPDDHDVFVIDCYPNNYDGTISYRGLEAGGRLVEIGLERGNTQFIPNFGAAYPPSGQPASLIEQYEWWDAWYQEREGEPLEGIGIWYSGIGSEWPGVYNSTYLEEEAREINRRLNLN